MESVLTVLPIGQGACNLVEVYDNSNELVFLGMVDCGNKTNEQAFNVAGYSGELNSNVNASYQYLREKMKARAQAFYGAGVNADQIYLDLFILTHQDGDHHNKFLNLLEGYVVGNMNNLTLNKGGYIYSYKDNSILSYPYLYSKLETYGLTDKLNIIIQNEYSSTGDDNIFLINIINMLKVIINKNPSTNRFTVATSYPSKRQKTFNFKIDQNKVFIGRDTQNPYEISDKDLLCKGLPGWEYYIVLKAFCESAKGKAAIGKRKLTELIKKQLKRWLIDDYKALDQIKAVLQSRNRSLCIIGEFLKGGASYEKQANNFVKRISARTKTYVDRAKSDYSYEIKNGNTTVGTVKVLCNLEIADLNKISIKDSHGTGPNYKNGSSLVTLWTIGDTKYLFPGDATVHTMMYLNTEYNKLPKDEHETCAECVKRQSAIMTAPHHGSDHSSKGKKQPASSETKYQGDWGIYREFLDNYKPSAVTISAGRNYGFGHPGPEFVKATDCYFNNRGANEHIIYTCIHEDSKNKYYGLYQTSSPIYSTLQYDGGDRNVRFQRLQFNNSITPNYEIVNESKIACQCNPNLSNYLTLDVGSCTGCSPKFIDESSRSSDWFKDYICETTIAEDENNEGEDDKTGLARCPMKGKHQDNEEEEVEMKGAAKERSNHKPMSEIPRPVKRRRTE